MIIIHSDTEYGEILCVNGERIHTLSDEKLREVCHQVITNAPTALIVEFIDKVCLERGNKYGDDTVLNL